MSQPSYNSIFLILYFVHMVQLFILTRVIKCMCAGVGETGAPREKPTIKPIFKINLAATNKLEYLINLSQGEAWQSWDVISDIKEFTQEGGPPRFSLWNWKVFHHCLHNVLTGRKVYLTLFSYLPQGSTKNSSLILLTKTGQVSNSKLVRLQQGLVKSSKPATQHDLGVVTASLLLEKVPLGCPVHIEAYPDVHTFNQLREWSIKFQV